MIRLPVQLDTPPAAALRALAILWAAGFLIAIIVQAGATWRVYEFRAKAEPAFASAGLQVQRQAHQDWTVRPIPRVRELDGLSGEWRFERIGGNEVPAEMSYGAVADLLRGPDGTSVDARLRRGGESRDIVLVRSAEHRVQAYAVGQRSFRIASQGIDVLIATLMLTAALLLRLKRFTDPMAIIFSFALLFLAMVGTWRFWSWLGLQPMRMIIDAMWLGIALFALPAFPSGRFVPPWSRFFLLAGPAAAVLLVIPDLPAAAGQAIRGTLLVAVLACVVIRFRRTPPGASVSR